MLDKNLPHEVCRNPKEMRAILPPRRILTRKAQIRFVDQGGALQRVVATLALQIMMRQAPQFGVDQRHQRLQRLAVPVPPANQQSCYRT
jgi:hypothetical protein